MVGRYQFAEPHQQWRRVGEASRHIRLDVGEGVGRGDARRAQLIGGEQVAAAHRDDRDAGGAGGGRDAGRRLAVQGLLVERALAGDDEVGAGQLARGSRPGPASDRCRAAVRRRAAASAANPTPPAAPAPGARGDRHRSPRRRRPPTGSAQRRVREPGQGSAPFCGPYTAAAPCRSGQRVVHIAGDHERYAGHPFAQPRQVDRSRPGASAAPPSGTGAAVGVEQACAEADKEPGAAVGAGGCRRCRPRRCGNPRRGPPP